MNVTEPIPIQHLRCYGQVYPTAWQTTRELRGEWRKMPDYKDWCYLPLAGAYSIISATAEAQGLSATTGVIDVGNLGALIAWRMGQDIYRFDPLIYESLWNTPLDGKLPVEMLYRMPTWCAWIETPNDPILKSPGFFAYLEYDMNTGRPELRFSISDGQQLGGQILHLTCENLVDCLEEAYMEGLKQAEKAGQGQGAEAIKFGSKIAEALKPIIAPRLSLLLYLCTENPEIDDASGKGRTPARPKPQKTRQGQKLFPASAPARWEVAIRMGAKIRAAQEHRERGEYQGDTHAGPKPHIRKAHWHVSPMGKGRTGRKVYWVPPWGIAGYDLEGDNPAVFHGVE
jgi:hypothetical protein